jgi:hypothetical protein
MADGRRIWEFKNLPSGHVIRGELVAYWELESDPVSDDTHPGQPQREEAHFR